MGTDKIFQPLSDLQWRVIEPFFPKPEKNGRGQPHAAWRAVFNSVLYILQTGAKWDSLPKDDPQFASKSTAHRWYKTWKEDGFLDTILKTVASFSRISLEIHLPLQRMRGHKPETPLDTQSA